MIIFNMAPLIAGLTFGFSSGISPGPLCFLTISETLRKGFKNGLKIGCAPLITDLPIIFFSLFIFNKLTHSGNMILSLIALAGAVFLFFLAYKSATFKFSGLIDLKDENNSTLIKGITTNFLNPYPYLFWITVGAPYIISLKTTPIINTWGFILMFYMGMIFAKLIIISTAAKGRKLLSSNSYIYCMRIISFLMFCSAIGFIMEASQLYHKVLN